MTGVIVLVVSGFTPMALVPAVRALDGAVCVFYADDGRVEPGIAATTSKGTWHAGPTTFHCQGAVAGQLVTGPGIIALSGAYEGNCQSGTGSGMEKISIPTTDGIIDLDIPITFSWVRSTGSGSGPGAAGTFEIKATTGDCSTTPVTGYRLLTQEFLTGGIPVLGQRIGRSL